MTEEEYRETGRTAQDNNIAAAKIIADTIRSTLGPKGMDKMLVDKEGNMTVTNDGVTILEEMNIEHPSAKMIVEIAKTQETEIGDGTTSAVILAGEILSKTEELLHQNVHPTVITKGLRLASEKSAEILEKISVPYEKSMIKNIAKTAMTGKGSEYAKEKLSDIVLEISELVDDFDNVKLEVIPSGKVDDSYLVKGVVLDKERLHPDMPTTIEDGKIALINSQLEVRETEFDAKIQINNPEEIQEYLKQEESMLHEIVNRIKKSGANIVFCQKGIDDLAQHYLAQEGICAMRRVSRSDMELLSKATGAKISNDTNISESDLGTGKLSTHDGFTFIDCKDPKAVTVVIKGGTLHVVSEVKRAMLDAIGDVKTLLKDKRIVGGAGSCETELAQHITTYAKELDGKEKLVVLCFAESLHVIAKTLAENGGLDPIDMITTLIARHEKKETWAGIDVFTGEIIDALSLGIIEPLSIKTQAISSAIEVASMILRIDDVIGAKSPKHLNT